jgi:hypothetical protein
MNEQGNDTSGNTPLYHKIFFREICKRNITNIITLNHYYNGGVCVLLGISRKEWLVSNTHTF